MLKLIKGGVYYTGGKLIKENVAFMREEQKREAVKGTIAYRILKAHNVGGEDDLKLKFDALASHDITYVGIIQTAKASGLERFPVPYTLTNCHNSLCAVGGTINEDDHMFGLSAAKKYGGNFVPPHLAVIHQYMREMQAGCGKMILGSDSHTRYGALGTMAVGEGGPELVKQLLGQTYDVPRPKVIAVYLKGRLKKGVGPHDVAIALVGATFKKGFVKNCVLEFVGPGIANLSMDTRNAIDVMTTETACLSSIWETDSLTEEYFVQHGREGDFKPLRPADPAYYDGAVVIDLSRIEPMIALPFHPSNAFTLREVIEDPRGILGAVEEAGNKLKGEGRPFRLLDKVRPDGVHVSQGIIAGCAGGSYENIARAAEILRGRSCGFGEFSLSVYPQSQPVFKCLADNGYVSTLMDSGAVIKTAFCGPCFGAGDTPADNALSIRHTTRNFENREGSKLGEKQLAAVALMDACSIAATAANGGVLTPGTEVSFNSRIKKYYFDAAIYKNRVYSGAMKPQEGAELVYGNNIADWPEQLPLGRDLLIKVVSVIDDPVTTTDELIPSGETSSYRSNPMRLAEFALSRKDPAYVGRAKAVRADEEERRRGGRLPEGVLKEVGDIVPADAMLGSCVVARKPGDGSAREQAASCQRVLGGVANIALEYATKRYRSNLINWGMLPLVAKSFNFGVGDYVYIADVRSHIAKDDPVIPARHISGGKVKDIYLTVGPMTEEEKKIILSGCLINYNKK